MKAHDLVHGGYYLLGDTMTVRFNALNGHFYTLDGKFVGFPMMDAKSGRIDVANISYDDWKTIQPVPLTPEIFEKNGFMDIDTLGAAVCCGHDIYYKSGDGYGFNVVEIMRPFHYVHELLQALRLCGFNDLADNFKV